MAKKVPEDRGSSDDEQRGDDAGSESGSEVEEEYEIEAILESKAGMFEGGRVGYLVKWKGYDDSQNSWVDEKDAGNAHDLIDDFWRRKKKQSKSGTGRKSDIKPRTGPGPSVSSKGRKFSVSNDIDSESEPAPKKRGRPSKAKAPKSASEDEEEEKEAPKLKKSRKSTGSTTKKATGRTKAASPDSDAMELDEEMTYVDMSKWAKSSTWEHVVETINTVERTEDGKLFVYFTLHSGDHGREESAICKEKMPQKLLDFYETNLRWRAADESEA